MAATAVQARDVYRPDRSIKIDGKDLDTETAASIVEVSFVDDIEDIDSFVLKVSNPWNTRTSSFPYSGTDQFAPGRTVQLALGYRGAQELTEMIKGEITSISPLYPADGPALLTVRGRSLQAKLLGKQISQVYAKMKDSQIAKQIAGRLGVTLRTDDRAEMKEPLHDYVFQVNSYAIVFLKERARRLGYELMIEDSNGSFALYFGPSEHLRDQTYKLTYGKDLHEFHPTLDTASQVDKVTVNAWDWVNKKKLTATSTRGDFPRLTRRDGPVAKAFSKGEEILVDFPVDDTDCAMALARGTMERMLKQMVTGYGSATGIPDVRAGTAIDLDGLDERFNGRYFVTGTNHTFGPQGYHTHFTCRLEDA